MSTRSVRLDDEAENALKDIVDHTGMSISDAIKQGLVAYRAIAIEKANRKPSEFFQKFDLGNGGYSLGPARQSKQLLKDKLKAKRHGKS